MASIRKIAQTYIGLGSLCRVNGVSSIEEGAFLGCHLQYMENPHQYRRPIGRCSHPHLLHRTTSVREHRMLLDHDATTGRDIPCRYSIPVSSHWQENDDPGLVPEALVPTCPAMEEICDVMRLGLLVDSVACH